MNERVVTEGGLEIIPVRPGWLPDPTVSSARKRRASTENTAHDERPLKKGDIEKPEAFFDSD